MTLIRILDAREGPVAELQALRTRSLGEVSPQLEEEVRRIMADVKDRGDEALVELTRRLDCPGFSVDQITIGPDEFHAAYQQVPDAWVRAFRNALANVRAFQERAKEQSWLETFDGLILGHHVTAVRSAGLYVPAKAAPLPSSLLMSAIPAQVAGVPRIVFATPPRPDGSVDPTMLVAAAECGVHEAYRMGGAQAIAALAFGTQTVAPVVKIVGPGNPWVSVAKKYAFGIAGIDSIAGPSESLIIADDFARPDLVAADLLTQAEHTGDNTVILLTPSENLASRTLAEMERQIASLERSELTRESLSEHSFIVLTKSIEHSARIANDIAPEHLQILVRDPFDVLECIENAGCIFLGENAPVPIGDYAAGPSHVLPTYGTARFSAPLSVNDFLKVSSVVYANRHGFERIGPDVIELAQGEGLQAHAEAVRRRLNDG
ncbi:MAG: histidinol dehydrogenase [Armatimonadetes bacterium]|nr:histidinol dehydrogenase [Armatimonadota bacterium]